jgi:exopolysaccharide biosynthesis protein
MATTVHIARYDRADVRPRIVLFDERKRLAEWCAQNGYLNAINGGYFLRDKGQMLGEVWQNGIRIPSVPFGRGWSGRRGSILTSPGEGIRISPRDTFGEAIRGDLLEIGPTLVHRGESLFVSHKDPEGFSATAYQHDEDINCKRHPRAAIGCNDGHVWTVTVDGRTDEDGGMYLDELAEVFLNLGATEAVNLDGGSSASQVVNGKLMNRPRTTKWVEPHRSLKPTVMHAGEQIFENAEGFPVYCAVVLN